MGWSSCIKLENHITQNDFTAYIGLSAVIAVYAEVVGIVKSAFVAPVAETVVSDLFGDCGDILKGNPGLRLFRCTCGHQG